MTHQKEKPIDMFSAGPTPLDVTFVLFGIPVRVNPMFWLMAAALGWGSGDLPLVLIWVWCVFFSVLIHELGHALTAEWFGWRSSILLYFGGGLAFSDRYVNNTPGRSVIMSLMGPMAQFLLLGIVLIVLLALRAFQIEIPPYASTAFNYLIIINIFWPILNLLPILPLDGGRILQGLLDMFRIRRRSDISRGISVVLAAAVAVWCFSENMPFGTIMFGLIAWQNASGAFDSRAY
ncbi:hypothetical protein A6X21_14885 [Planctopirus hydrillae]|uniref:Peptidase M50 domain-containing protein n=2 Tax=Planctopirus hydrillae TaxID=1841610 RepID=A0A1C3E4I4_9PLAN|nr:hypothetical protein A6X21_14885 [Planctopirus hydrillae]